MSFRAWFVTGIFAASLLGTGVMPRASALSGPAISDDATGSVSQLSVATDTQVPGKTLKAGEYTIRIVDHLSDRMIVRVERNGKMQSTFLAVPSSGLAKAGSGAIPLGSGAGAKSALRGFAFPNGTTAEFVYPKAEAVGLAKANDTKIPAIDPASQGMKGNPSLSQTDRQMVTLWLLSPTPVGPDAAAGIQAERYKPTQVANTNVPSAPAPARQPVSSATAPVRQPVASAAVSTRQQDAVTTTPTRPKTRPAMTALPHTASLMPLVWLAGLMSLVGGSLMARRRLVADR